MKKIGFLLVLVLLAGCGDIKVVRRDSINSEPVESFGYIKSYNIGENKTAYIGNPIVKWQDSKTRRINTSEVFIAKSDFELKGDYIKRDLFTTTVNIKSFKNDEYLLFGTTNYKNTDYYVIARNLEDNKYYLLVNNNGIMNKNILIDEHLDRKLLSENPISSPDTIVFNKKQNKEESLTLGMSREIIFGGVNDITLNATYREYSPDDMARQAFYQNLVYQTSTDTIRFREFKIKVHEVTNEKINFTVLEDGLTNPKSPEK